MDDPTPIARGFDLEEELRARDSDLYRLLTQEVVSLGHWDVLRYFEEMEQEEATLDAIGAATGRDSTEMLGILGSLTTAGWLARRSRENGETAYVLTLETEHRDLLDRLRVAMHDPRFRLLAMFCWTVGRRS